MIDQNKQDLFEYLLRMGDSAVILGHRLSEWCGRAHALEEELALANIGLDCLGQGQAYLATAGQLEGQGRDEDALVYFRDAGAFRNVLLVEQPNGDFAQTIVRQFLYDAYLLELLQRLSSGSEQQLSAIAQKSLKEVAYHLRHATEWFVRLGDGTEESHARMQRALGSLWRFTGELFLVDEIERRLAERGVVVLSDSLQDGWNARVDEVLSRAGLKRPAATVTFDGGGRVGRHTEYLGHLLAEMQILARSHPGAQW